MGQLDERAELDDAELARRIAAAPGACAEDERALYDRFAPRVMRYGLRHLRDRALAEDLAHDVLLIVIEALRAGRVREPDQVASFVLGTARNHVRADRRKEALHQKLLGGAAREAHLTQEPAVAPGRLVSCFDRLSERERRVLLLTFYEERPIEEIAAAVEASSENVRVVRHRALLRLRACIENGGAE